MRIALIPPAFTPYQDDSHFSTIFLCQQIGEYFKSRVIPSLRANFPKSLMRHFEGYRVENTLVSSNLEQASNSGKEAGIAIASLLKHGMETIS